MKKLKLNLKDVGEILTRDQLKQVFGGSGGSGDNCPRYYCHCIWSTGAWEGTYCSESEINNAVDRNCASQLGICQ